MDGRFYALITVNMCPRRMSSRKVRVLGTSSRPFSFGNLIKPHYFRELSLKQYCFHRQAIRFLVLHSVKQNREHIEQVDELIGDRHVLHFNFCM